MGSLDGRARRVRRLEERARGEGGGRPSRTQEEAWAIDAEIARIESEMRAQGIDPATCLRDVGVGLPLDEHIAKL